MRKTIFLLTVAAMIIISLGGNALAKQIATEGTVKINEVNDLFVIDQNGGRIYFGHLNDDTVLMRIKNGAIKNISARELLALKKKIKVRGVTEEMEFVEKIPYSYLQDAPEYGDFYSHLYQTGRKISNCLLFIVIIE